MIKIKIDNGKCECEVDGKPAVIAAELVQIEKAVFEQITKNGLIDLTAFGIVYHALLKTIAENAYKKANLKCNCEES